jgi:general L-amino acid transport system permease protein
MAANTTTSSSGTSSPLAVLRDVRVLQIIGQIIFVVLVVVIGAILVSNAYAGLQRANLVPSFDFLRLPSSFQIDDGLITAPHSGSDTFFHAFAVGFVNTLRVLFVGLVGASVLGLFVGIGRLSTNFLIRNICRIYIEIFQNTPLLIQLIFLYYGVFLQLPLVREAQPFLGVFYVSRGGIAMPALWPNDRTLLWTALIAVSAVVAFVIYATRRRRMVETGQVTRPFEWAALFFVGVFVVSFLFINPYDVSLPARIPPSSQIRFNSNVGVLISVEYVAVCAGLILYTGAFIAEIVRSGIQSVSKGQREAADALGLSAFQKLRLIILPQALRVMFPPLTNQYSALLKNSALGAYIGFPDFFGVGRTIGNQSAQPIPVIFIVIVVYVALTLIIAFAMNVLNARFQLKTR